MKSETLALALQPPLLREVQQTAQETGLSLADAIRQGLVLGLPRLRQRSAMPSLRPFTAQESQEAFAPDPEWDLITAAMAQPPIAKIEE